MKYFFISICILCALWACGSDNDPLSNINQIQDNATQTVETTKEQLQQRKEDAGLKLRAFLTQAADVIEGATQGARAKLEEQAAE